MPNYRTDWLEDEDHVFIREHYVSLADDFWVLGRVLPSGGGEFQVIHPGRYRISPLSQSRLAGTYSYDLKGLIEMSRPPSTNDPPFVATLDGQTLTDKPVELKAGTHRIQTKPDCQPAAVWVGPNLDRPPLAGPGDHRTLFVNWY